MKRVIAVISVVLLLMFVLACSVCAAESYIFELQPNIEYYDSIIVPSVGSCFIYEGVVPDGDYLIKAEINDAGMMMFLSSDSPVHLSFGSNQIYYDVGFSVNINGEVASSLCRVGSWGGDGFAIVTIEDSYGAQISEALSYIELVPVDYPPVLVSFLNDAVSVGTSSLDFVVDIANAIVSNSFLLLNVGFLFIGGCIGVFRCMSDRL